MSNARDLRRRLGAYPRAWKTPNYDRFLKTTLEGYTWKMTRMLMRPSVVARLFAEMAGHPIQKKDYELISDLQAWARREAVD